MAQNFFINLMMTEELSLPIPSEDDKLNSLKDGDEALKI